MLSFICFMKVDDMTIHLSNIHLSTLEVNKRSSVGRIASNLARRHTFTRATLSEIFFPLKDVQDVN